MGLHSREDAKIFNLIMIVTFERDSNPQFYSIYLRELEFHSRVDKKLSANYAHKNMDIDSQIAFSIGYRNDIDSPFALSSIYRRNTWPEGAYRILNRSWKPLGEEDTSVTLRLDALWTDMIDSQIEWLQNNRPDYTASIISREHNARNSLTNLIKRIHAVSHNRFTLCDERVWLCENRNNPESCYQDFIYTGNDEVIAKWVMN